MTDALPPFASSALLLDLDGTLLDFAATPDGVIVPSGLGATLTRLRGELDDALAIVTGRPIEQIDALLPGIVPVIAGEHGGALRPAADAQVQRPNLPSVPPDVVQAAEALAAAHPGALVERKARGCVVHFRRAPAAGAPIHAALKELLQPLADRFQLLAANMAWEVRPTGVDKGHAVAAIMALPGFADRRPIFIGDDVTDEDGLAAARRLGGAGLFVPSAFGSPAAVRDWLARCRGEWAALPEMVSH